MTAASLTAAPTAEARNRARFLRFLRVFAGLALLAVLAYLLWTPGTWTTKLMAWVLVTLLADELGGWFGYIGLGLGVLGLLAPETPLQQWLVIFPLVGGLLAGLLLVKHSGGPFVLPFGALLFAGVIFAVGRYGAQIDPSLKLPANETFQRAALLPMLVGVGVSFIRQLAQNFIGYQGRKVSAAPQDTAPLDTAPHDTTAQDGSQERLPPAAPVVAAREVKAADSVRATPMSETDSPSRSSIEVIVAGVDPAAQVTAVQPPTVQPAPVQPAIGRVTSGLPPRPDLKNETD